MTRPKTNWLQKLITKIFSTDSQEKARLERLSQKRADNLKRLIRIAKPKQ